MKKSMSPSSASLYEIVLDSLSSSASITIRDPDGALNQISIRNLTEEETLTCAYKQIK
jgi:hypothetical protein